MPHTKVDNIRIYHETRGTGAALLLIAGLAGDLHAWDRQIDAYTAHHMCVRVDNRGVGRSDKPANGYSTERFAQDALAVMDVRDVGRFHVAGQSMGGAIVQQLMLLAPQRLLSATIHCSWARCDRHLEAIFRAWTAVRQRCSLAEYNLNVLPWLLSVTSFRRNPQLVERVRAEMDAAEVPQPAGAFAAQARACIEHDALDALVDCEVPTLVTVGSEDIFTPPRFSLELHQRLPVSELHEFRGLGHCSFLEAPDAFSERTLRFMSKFDPSKESA